MEEVTLLCVECGQPVTPEEAFPVELAHADGTSEVAIFHAGLDKMCVLKWSSKRLESAGNKLALILLIYKDIFDEAKKANEQLRNH
jgi:hypothetical protein